jgi:diacylglycerol kinase family enzyme
MPLVPIILNSRAGGTGASRDEEIRAAFESHGASAEISNAADGTELTSLVRACVDRGSPVVVIGGGDGSLHTAAGILAGSDTALGILPVGTLNHFAKDLGIPIDLQAAVAVIVAGVIRRVDLGEANGTVFVNNASLGLYPSVVLQREALRRRLGHGKWTAFAIAIWRSLLHYRLLVVRVRIGDRDHVRRTPFLFIGNNSYVMDGLNVGSRAALDQGVLSVYMARREGPVSLLLLALRALLGRARQAEDFEEFTATEVAVETRRSREHVSLDGEVASVEMPLRCRIRPLDLKVVVPQD